MTPAACWTPHDYYTASRRARRAWEETDSQLTFGLGETDAGTADPVASVSPSPPSPQPTPHVDGTPSSWEGKAGSTPTTTEASANQSTERARLQEGT